MQPPGAPGVDRVGRLALRVFVAVLAADALVAAAAKRPTTVLRRRAVAGEQDAPDVGRHAGVVERGVELVDGVRAERVADLRPVECDPHHADGDGAVVRDVGELEARDGGPRRRVEDLRDRSAHAPCRPLAAAAPHTLNCADDPACRGAARDRARGRPGGLISDHAELADGDVVVVTSKIVSKAEGCTVELAAVTPSAFATEWATTWNKDPRLVEVVLSESARIVRQVGDLLITETRHGFVCANSGVDQSSSGAAGRVLVLPSDPDASAGRVCRAALSRAGRSVAVIVTDTFGHDHRHRSTRPAERGAQTPRRCIGIGRSTNTRPAAPLDNWSTPELAHRSRAGLGDQQVAELDGRSAPIRRHHLDEAWVLVPRRRPLGGEGGQRHRRQLDRAALGLRHDLGGDDHNVALGEFGVVVDQAPGRPRARSRAVPRQAGSSAQFRVCGAAAASGQHGDMRESISEIFDPSRGTRSPASSSPTSRTTAPMDHGTVRDRVRPAGGAQRVPPAHRRRALPRARPRAA